MAQYEGSVWRDPIDDNCIFSIYISPFLCISPFTSLQIYIEQLLLNRQYPTGMTHFLEPSGQDLLHHEPKIGEQDQQKQVKNE